MFYFSFKSLLDILCSPFKFVWTIQVPIRVPSHIRNSFPIGGCMIQVRYEHQIFLTREVLPLLKRSLTSILWICFSVTTGNIRIGIQTEQRLEESSSAILWKTAFQILKVYLSYDYELSYLSLLQRCRTFMKDWESDSEAFDFPKFLFIFIFYRDFAYVLASWSTALCLLTMYRWRMWHELSWHWWGGPWDMTHNIWLYSSRPLGCEYFVLLT